MKTYNCIFTGGSVRGLCYVGALKAFEDNNIKINCYSGSSMGAIFMTMYALGYSAEEIKNELDKTNLCFLFSDFNFNLISDFALSKGRIYLHWLREKIESKYYGKNYVKGKMKPVCFKDLDKEIYIIATDLEESLPFVFSKETTPDTEVAVALRISSSMPGLLPIYKFQNKFLIDGDILRAKPIWDVLSFLLDRKETILEFRITGGNQNKVSKNPIKLVNSIVNVAAYTIDNEYTKMQDNNKIQKIQIDIDGVSFIEFNLSKTKKEEIYMNGYLSTQKYIKNQIN